MKISKEYVMSVEHISHKNGETQINCPNCDDESMHMYINFQKGVYTCHKCGARGRVADKIESSLENFEKLLKHPLLTQEQFYEYMMNEPKQIKTLPHCLPLYGFSAPLPKYSEKVIDATKYLSNRGLDNNDIKHFDIRVSLEETGPYVDTIIFPFYNEFTELRQQLDFFVARRYTDQQPKYINAPWTKDTPIKMGPRQTAKNNDIVVIVEGIFDAIAITKMGYNCIALLSKTCKVEWLEVILMHGKKFIIYLDHDAFPHAAMLAVQLRSMSNAIGRQAQLRAIIGEKMDAADLYVKDPNDLRSLLDDAVKSFG